MDYPHEQSRNMHISPSGFRSDTQRTMSMLPFRYSPLKRTTLFSEIPINNRDPRIMHIDLNACFAMTEQQANPLLRGRPIAVTNRLTRTTIIIAPSYEAKRLGIRCGTTVEEAYNLAPDLIVIETDPAKYTYVHRKIVEIFEDYTPSVTMKSIDEGILDFTGMEDLLGKRTLEDVGHEIKARVAEELGEWMTVNVGIGTNRFLAKVAAGLNKPDGLDALTSHNLEVIYGCLDLMDLPGINKRYSARLRAHGITTPLEFLAAPERLLTKQVFKSINGRHWYLRLRGYEVDNYSTKMKTVGKQFVLHQFTSDPEEIAQVVYEMAIHVGRRMRKHGVAARGLYVGAYFVGPKRYDIPPEAVRWHGRQLFPTAAWRGEELYYRAMYLLDSRPKGMRLKSIVISGYRLEEADSGQLSLYEGEIQRANRLEEAIHSVNDRYGELVVAPATLLDTQNRVSRKIAFGSTRYFDS
jgi:DNA polymerase IV